MNDNRFVIEKFEPKNTYYQQKKFDCGNHIINKFVHSSLKKQVSQQFSQAFVLLDLENKERFSAFYTLTSFKLNANDLESLSQGSLPRDIPCVRLVMLGVDTSIQGQGIGRKMMSDALHRVHRASKDIGIYGLYLDAEPSAINFYLSLGFTRLDGGGSEDIGKMFLSISVINQLLD
ncbi:GNAT family N-acetyltransferase [Catenovulum agarivorans]|uniref:GNAT family N-acetyltransferase n=1 Tax=Catenovulum agarivorans TaxID=1172192 RepID=UPI0003059815|nr:GNAT family N-acetyltransferase [Catenovulum agarivorans]